jgi:hypothetical protein
MKDVKQEEFDKFVKKILNFDPREKKDKKQDISEKENKKELGKKLEERE